MANNFNYVTKFEHELIEKYKRELLTAGLTTESGYSFVNAKTVKIPCLELKGYKNHNRGGGFNRQDAATIYRQFELSHDRDVEFFVDSADVDETNQAAAAANITNQFEQQHAIPETDCYRISKIYKDCESHDGNIDTTAITVDNIMEVFDSMMSKMDDGEVPVSGRILYVTPAVYRMLKNAESVQRTIEGGSSGGVVDRNVRLIDDVEIVIMPSSRMMSKYDFSDGCMAASDAKQINMILIHPSSVIAVNKHSYIKLWPEGSHTVGDGYLYQNRQYFDIFLIEDKVDGVTINVES